MLCIGRLNWVDRSGKVAGKVGPPGVYDNFRLAPDEKWIAFDRWSAAMEATMFTGWICYHLKPHAAALKVAHPLLLGALASAKKKNDRIDADKICYCLRCDFLPEFYMAAMAIGERRRALPYRNQLVRQMLQTKIEIITLLMGAGVSYKQELLHVSSDHCRGRLAFLLLVR